MLTSTSCQTQRAHVNLPVRYYSYLPGCFSTCFLLFVPIHCCFLLLLFSTPPTFPLNFSLIGGVADLLTCSSLLQYLSYSHLGTYSYSLPVHSFFPMYLPYTLVSFSCTFGGCSVEASVTVYPATSSTPGYRQLVLTLSFVSHEDSVSYTQFTLIYQFFQLYTQTITSPMVCLLLLSNSLSIFFPFPVCTTFFVYSIPTCTLSSLSLPFPFLRTVALLPTL